MFFWVAFIGLLLDRVFKYLVQTKLAPSQSWISWGDFSISYFQNFKGPFSLYIPMGLILALSLVVVGTVFFLSFKTASRTQKLGLALVIAGGLSNLTDRLLFGYTIDYLGFPFQGFWNLADIYILAGCLALLFAEYKSGQVSGKS
ncbi:MAG: signal peptidase II [bacterium]